jgi:hypothetical protein
MTKRRRTDNAMAKRRRTDNASYPDSMIFCVFNFIQLFVILFQLFVVEHH